MLASRDMPTFPIDILQYSPPVHSYGIEWPLCLSLHAKQPKRGLIAFDKGYVELYEYPRGQEAVITYTKDGHTETIREGETNRALEYEVLDMEAAVAGEKDDMHLDYTRDVMDMMTQIRQEWGMRYPEEE